MSNLPAFLQNRKSTLAERGLANVGFGAPPYISIKGNKFMLIDAGGNEQLCAGQKVQADGIEYAIGGMDKDDGAFLDVVIVDLSDVTCKVYYAEAYDPNVSIYTPPDCWSDNGIGPSKNSTRKIAYESGVATCAACPMNQWGSAISKITSQGIKACNDVEKLAVLVPGIPGMLFLLRLPPGSRTNWRAYLTQYQGQEVGPDGILTRIYFDQRAIGILQFKAVSYIDEATNAHVVKAQETKAADGLVGRLDVVAPSGILVGPQPTQQAVTFQPQQPMALPQGPANMIGAQASQSAQASAPTQSPLTAGNGQGAQPTGRGRGRPKGSKNQPEAPQPAAAGPAPSDSQQPFAGMVQNPPSAPAELQTQLKNFFQK
jgi:hypothetical protein